VVSAMRRGGSTRQYHRGVTAVIAATVVALVVVATLLVPQARGGGAAEGTVAFLLPDQTFRWNNQDGPFFQQAMKKIAPGAKVQLFNARANPSLQLQQVENALTGGAKVLVVVPVDAAAASRIVDTARQQKVPVLSYARLIQNSAVDYAITGDVREMGRLQGKWLRANTRAGDKIAVINGSADDPNSKILRRGAGAFLDPLFKSKARRKVSDVFTPQWDPANAQKEMENVLTKQRNDIQGVLVANDGMASGVIAALRAQRLAGKIPVTGLDASLGGLELIAKGEQGMTVLIPIKQTANLAARIVAPLLAGKKPPAALFTAKTFNGKVNVPTARIPVKIVTKKNLGLPVKTGNLTKKALCKVVPAGTPPC
jgi:D-xylose transport system substrate-binding protein